MISRSENRRVHARLRKVLTTILVIAYFGFLLAGAFASATLAQPLHAGGIVPLSFALGLALIVGSVVLTGIYVVLVNRSEVR